MQSSEVADNIEKALGAFDFLESAQYAGDLSPMQENKTILDENARSSSPEPASTGNPEADHALLLHLTYCERLLEVTQGSSTS